MELLLPMAAKKLDLSYNIEPDVPECMHLRVIEVHIAHTDAGIYADNARISQGAAYLLVHCHQY